MSSDLSFSAGGRTVTLELKPSARAKAMRLRVDARDGRVILTLPRRASIRRAVAWADGHRGWVEAQLAAIPDTTALVPGAMVPLEGEPHRIDWHADRSRSVRIEGDRLVVGGSLDGLEARLLRWLRMRALGTLSADTSHYAARAGVGVTRVAVGDPVSRWGSCAASGAIRYSWRLILAPAWVRRATAAHEVAHRVHMNHGPAFHALVAQLFEADPTPARLWLRRNGASLHRIGGRRAAG